MNRLTRILLSRADGMYRRWMDRREYLFPGEVECIPDIPYLDDGSDAHKMDVYRPKQFAGTLPVIINLHGGGLVLCSRAVNRPFCAELAEQGYLVFCLDYPLVPERQVPQILSDVCVGIDVVDSLLEQYGGCREKVYLVGDSAGAFLAVYAAAVQSSALIAEAAGVTAPKLPIRALGLVSGMFHTAETDSTGLFLRSSFYGKNWRRHPLMPYLKPEKKAVAGRMPPCFLITSRSDALRPGTLRFYRGLRQEGILCKLLDLPRQAHDFVIMNPGSPESRQAIRRMLEFLDGAAKR